MKAPSETFCVLPWIHMYVSPEGTAQPCCINRPETSITYGNVNENSWAEMWNGDAIRKFRLDLLAGKKRPDVCAGCYHLEDQGLLSHRQRNNEKFADLIGKLAPETREDGSLDQLRIYYWDFRFSNLCNLKCRTCGPMYSSRWKDDYAKAGKLNANLISDLDRTREGDYREFLGSQIEYAREIYFAGGEPLLSADHYYVLEELIRRGRTEVALTYSSNSTSLELRGKQVIDYWRNFKNVNFMVSVDDIGPRAGYLRSGSDWETLVENVKRIRREAPHVSMTAVVTVSIFNVLRLREIHETLVENQFLPPGAPDDVVLNILRAPEFLQPGVLPPYLRKRAVERLSKYQDELSARKGSRVSLFDPVIAALQEDFSHNLTKFYGVTRMWDGIRREKVSASYPELGNLRFFASVVGAKLKIAKSRVLNQNLNSN